KTGRPSSPGRPPYSTTSSTTGSGGGCCCCCCGCCCRDTRAIDVAAGGAGSGGPTRAICCVCPFSPLTATVYTPGPATRKRNWPFASVVTCCVCLVLTMHSTTLAFTEGVLLA